MIDMKARETWEAPAQPIKGPPPQGTPGTWVVHYPGGGSYEPLTDEQVIAYLRAVQNDYLTKRGYSIGYSVGFSQSGSKWEIRGDDFNNAANAGRKVSGNFNHVSRSLFVMVGHAQPATPAAVAAINEVIATEPTWNVIIHGDVDWTACCGAGLIVQVRAGVIGHQLTPVPPVIPPRLPPVGGYNPPDDWGLYPLNGNKETIREGSTGNLVRYCQDVIFYYSGGDILVDGVFGSETKRRVMDVQRQFEFPSAYVDGIVGNDPNYPTWEILDYLVMLNIAPPVPTEPPPSVGVEACDPCMYYVNQGDSPWSTAELVYGSGTQNGKLDHSAFSMYSTPHNPVFVATPGVPGKKTTVKPGEGALAILRRLGYSAPNRVLDRFYDWNGGWERPFYIGDLVHMPT